MKLIPLGFDITRDRETGKKLYDGNIKPKLPRDWETFNERLRAEDIRSYAIRPDNDLVVIDCDSLDATKAIDSLNITDTYVVVSDKGEKHFYFKPSKYFNESVLTNKPNRVKVNSIDVLKGKSLVFTACVGNTTKSVFNGHIDHIEEIPDSIVDYLVENLTKAIQSYTGDYVSTLSYMGARIEEAITLYIDSRDYQKHLEAIFRVITPMAYKDMVKPDYHPDRVLEGEGTGYIQALSSKIAGDPSISEELHASLIELITTHLWSDCWSNIRLADFLSNLTTQTYPDGTPVFRYIPNMSEEVLVSSNGYGYVKVYRTVDDNYIIPKADGGVPLLINSLANFKKTLQSSNFVVRYAGADLSYQELTSKVMSKLISSMETVTLVNRNYLKAGENLIDGELLYNTYQPTAYLAIIRGEHLQHRESRSHCPHHINKILNSLMRDHSHEDRERLKRLFHEFISHKLKTMEYSPLVFHLMGQQGTGKDALLDGVLGIITQQIGIADFTSSNSQFNSDWVGCMFVKLPEIVITPKVLNDIKQVSGSVTIKEQGKGANASYQRNTLTLMASSNKSEMLTTQTNDRRVVTFSAFTGKRLSTEEVNEKLIAPELIEYCLFLRDLPITTPLAYTNAVLWLDNTMRDLAKEEAESYRDIGTQLKILLDHKDRTDPYKFKYDLEELIEVYFVARGRLTIPLKGETKDGIVFDTDITPRQARALGFVVSRDTNPTRYTKVVNAIRVDITKEQGEIMTRYLLILLIASHLLNADKCEDATIKATTIAMRYAISGKGYKTMIIADNNTTRLCKLLKEN